jgi:hypothetical protein
MMDAAADTGTSHSVMTLSRYHGIYNSRVLESVKERVVRHGAPVTSFHLRAAGGVWNRECEYLERGDHPYKYGYGMLMHGAYHYVDLACQFLLLNTLVFGDSPLEMTVSAFGAFPRDQRARIPSGIAARLGEPVASADHAAMERFGETDVVASFRVRDVSSGATVTLGTLAFEQTTPSIRHWAGFPPDVYNKNGRVSKVELEAQLSTLYAIHVQCYDGPHGVQRGEVLIADPDNIDAHAVVSERANAAMLAGERFNSTESFSGLFHSDSNRALMSAWLRNEEERSRLATHRLPMLVTQALACAIRAVGETVTVRLVT